MQVLIPVTFNLLATSVAIIYIGCHRSLALRDKGAATDEEPVETISKEVGGWVLIESTVVFSFIFVGWVCVLLDTTSIAS